MMRSSMSLSAFHCRATNDLANRKLAFGRRTFITRIAKEIIEAGAYACPRGLAVRLATRHKSRLNSFVTDDIARN